MVSVVVCTTCSKSVPNKISSLEFNAIPLMSRSDPSCSMPYAWLPPRVKKIVWLPKCLSVLKKSYSDDFNFVWICSIFIFYFLTLIKVDHLCELIFIVFRLMYQKLIWSILNSNFISSPFANLILSINADLINLCIHRILGKEWSVICFIRLWRLPRILSVQGAVPEILPVPVSYSKIKIEKNSWFSFLYSCVILLIIAMICIGIFEEN